MARKTTRETEKRGELRMPERAETAGREEDVGTGGTAGERETDREVGGILRAARPAELRSLGGH